jgi:hypothetical protein
MPDHDPEVTPEQEARLRRLLAQARHGEPVPDDVAARLDRVLEQLAAGGLDPRSDHPGAVDELAARRRRRVRHLLLAAAAVVAVGVGVGQVVPTGDDEAVTSSDAAGSAAAESLADGADRADRAGGRAGAARESDSGAAEAAPEEAPSDESDAFQPAPPSLTYSTSPSAPVRLSEAGFAAQAERYRDRPGTRSDEGTVVPGQSLSRAETFVCDTAAWGAGLLLPALYDGVPAVLAYRPVAGATQTVDLLRCGTAEVLRSIVLPVED